MQTVVSAQPHHELRPFVRAYAQRVCDPHAVPVLQFVPAQLEQVINFEFGTMPGIRHQNRMLTDVVLLGGAQSSFSGYLELRPHVESFAIFFQPAGFSTFIATFHRKESLFQTVGTVALHSVSETLLWSSNFEFGGQTYNYNRIAPNGITFAQVSQRRATRRNRRLFCDVFRRGLCVCGRFYGVAALVAVNLIWPHSGRVLGGATSSARSRSCCSQRYAKQVADPGCFKREKCEWK
jgi:hypothetical protein